MATFEEVKKYIDSEYKLYIGGEWVNAVDEETFDVYCPSNGEKLATCQKGNEKDVNRAVEAAWKAFPAWSKMGQIERSKLLYKIADALDANMDKVNWAERLEAGVRAGMVSDHFRYAGSAICASEGVANHTVDHRINMVLQEPIGVVGQITPWNAPAGMACMKLAPALATGNCIVYRPSKETPISTLIMAKIIGELLPPGVLNVVTGDSATCGQAILDHPGILKISFTGSTETGINVAIAAAKKLIPATLELGGKSANIFFDDCDVKRALTGFYMGIYTMNGQVCAAGSRVLVQEGIYDMFVDLAVNMSKGLKVGPVWDDECKIYPLITQKHLKQVLNYVEIGKQEGARVLCGGIRLTEGDLAKGNFMAPTVIEATNDMRIAQEEIFGPVPVIIKFRTEEEAIAIANDSQYGLTGGVWTKDISKALRVATGVRTGSMWVNTYLQLSPGYPFGGYKKSGLGREIHKSTLEHYTQKKSIVINTSETLPV